MKVTVFDEQVVECSNDANFTEVAWFYFANYRQAT